jgi:PST family polysaccharide transporter
VTRSPGGQAVSGVARRSVAGAVPRPSATGHAAGWIAAEATTGIVGAVVTTFLVARLIGPAEVGRAALAAAVVMLVQPVAHYAFTNAMVRRDRLEPEEVAGVLWTSLGLALALALPIAGAGLLLPEWFAPGVGPVLAALAILLPLNAVEGTANGLLLRRGVFRALALRGIGAHLAALSIGVGLALAGAGAWAVVGQQLAFFGTAAALAAGFARLAPRLALRPPALREMRPYAVTSAVSGVAERGGFRIFLIAVAGGLPALAGVLQIAFRIVEVARDLPSPFVHRYGLPALSRLGGDRPAFLRRLEAICGLSGLVFAPVFVGLALCAPEVQAVLLGPAWAGIVAPVQVLSVALALAAFTLPFGMAFTAAGWPGLNLALTLSGIVLMLILALLVPEGSAGAAATAWAAALVADAAAAGVLAARRLGFSAARQLRLLATALLPAGAAAAAVLGAEAAGLLPLAAPLATLAAKIAIGAAAGGPLLLLLARRPWREVSAPVREAD